ncbi:serine/threonine-protein kinase TOR-like isoform X1 [Papaver somniferum]|uniref:serine/threonine-protein kinase TOR-like isoform X1 n=1 Tax=Papaver somniferum TaxID=3469 RepID=UPI000E701EFF|nr:serine/threonine-protein kinase TOR-like isoform X1 [Papaver somniferum]
MKKIVWGFRIQSKTRELMIGFDVLCAKFVHRRERYEILHLWDDALKAYIVEASRVNDGRLKTAGTASHRSIKKDWAYWMRHFSIELLKESISPAFRTCARLAQSQVVPEFCLKFVLLFVYLLLVLTIDRELFAAGFVSCWAQLNETCQKQLVFSLEMTFSSPIVLLVM